MEQDDCYDEDPFACLEKSYRFLQAQGSDDHYLEIAKMDFKNRIISGLDHPLSLIAQAFLDDLLHRDITPEQRIERIMQVTKEDISRVALQMNLASVAIVAEKENEL